MTTNAMGLADEIKQHARELGFQLVGTTTAEPFSDAERRTLDWLSAGMQAQLGWMNEERTRRACRPTDLLPDARSLIVVGVAYANSEAPVESVRRQSAEARLAGSHPNGSRGTVARYARGHDYHDVMRPRLHALAAYVRGKGGDNARTRVFVDSSPLAEREAAVRAGLGFIGKNTNLLTATAGSWVLLGAVLTNVPLDPDRPLLKDCGQCRLCLDACPTDALPAPYVLDANRCISYLTIEHRGAIAPELRPLMGSHVFGCDICQEVCPWNRAKRSIIWPELEGAPDSGSPSLSELLELDDQTFRNRFRGTPLTRTKRRGLLRNAAVALGNLRDSKAVTVLSRALSDNEPLVRGHAAWALGRIGGPAAREALEQAWQTEEDEDVLRELAEALRQLAEETVAPPSQRL